MLLIVAIMDFISAFLQWTQGNKKWGIIMLMLGIALVIKMINTGSIL